MEQIPSNQLDKLNYNSNVTRKLSILQANALLEAGKGARSSSTAKKSTNNNEKELIDYNNIKTAFDLEVQKDPIPQLVQIPKDNVKIFSLNKENKWRSADYGLKNVPSFAKPCIEWFETVQWTMVQFKEFDGHFGFPSTALYRKKMADLAYPDFEIDAPHKDSQGLSTDFTSPTLDTANIFSEDIESTLQFIKWDAKSSTTEAQNARNRDRQSLAALVDDVSTSTSLSVLQNNSVSLAPKDVQPFEFVNFKNDTRYFKVSSPTLNFDFCNDEPFWASLALYDISSGQKISENAYFTIRTSNASDKLEFIFGVTSPNPDIYLLLRVERVLQGDITSLFEKYSNLKGKKPSMDELRDIHQRLGSYRQPWVWAALPMFSICSSSDLAVQESRQGAIFKVDDDKCTDAEMCQLMTALAKGAILKKAKVIPGTFTARFEELLAENEADAMLIPKAQREFYQRPLYLPAMHYENDIFVYPLALNLAKINNGRNIYCKIELITGAGKAEMPGRESFGSNCPFGDTAVTYHSKNTEYYEEIKFTLPKDFANMGQWHILFTVYHITCKEKKEKDTETELGKAFLPLFSDGKWVPSGEYQLPIASSLAHDYISNPESALNKWYENKKPLLIFKLAAFSTVIPESSALLKCFSARQTLSKQVLDELESIPDSELTKFAVPLLQQLFSCLSSNFDTFVQLVNVVYRLTQSVPEKGILVLQHFANFHYKPQENSHSALEWVHHWNRTCKDISMAGKWSTTTWFFFSILAKTCFVSKETVPIDDLDSVVKAVSIEIVKKGTTAVVLAKKLNATLGSFFLQATRFLDIEQVFSWIHHHTMQLDAAANAQNDAAGAALKEAVDWPMATLKYQFLTLIAAHEHFVPLNLPLASYQSSSSNKSSGTLSEYWQRHFLIGVILNDVRKSLKHENPYLRLTSLILLQNLLVKHSLDERYNSASARARIMGMYWPFILLVCDHEQRLSSALVKQTGQVTSTSQTLEVERIGTCFFLVLKYLPPENVLKWLSRAETGRRESFYKLLRVFPQVFQYFGKHELQTKQKTAQQVPSTFSLTQDTKQAFEEWYSNTNKLKTRRGLNSRVSSAVSGNTGTAQSAASAAPPASIGQVSRLSMNSVLASTANNVESKDVQQLNPGDFELSCKIKALLANEVSLAVLQILEDILEDYHIYEYSDSRVSNQPKSLVELDRFFTLYQALLSVPQSSSALIHIARSMKNFVCRFSKYLMQTKNKSVLSLMQNLLMYLSTKVYASNYFTGVLYIALQRNYAEKNGNITKVQAQCAVALSQIELQREGPLVRSLQKLLEVVQRDPAAGSNRFIQLVREFADLLQALARDSAQIYQYRYDQETVAELHVRMAHNYANNSPDLRLATLETLVEMHKQAPHSHAEAAVGVLHSCKLVNAYLVATKQIDWQKWAIDYAWDLVLPNESKYDLDVLETDERQWSLWKEQGMCESAAFSKESLLQLLEKAFVLFRQANYLEAASQIAQILLFQYSLQKSYKEMSLMYQSLHQDASELANNGSGSKRISGTYFRVGFFQFPQSPVDGCEYVYKERPYFSLAEMCPKLTSCYSKKFGDRVCLIQDSGEVDKTKLDPGKTYIQVTALTPYTTSDRALSSWEKSTNIDEFMFETPYTNSGSGKAHGGVHEQCKRKTILKTERKFPDLQRRLKIVSSRTIELDPLEVAIEALEERTNKLAALACTNPQLPQEKPLAFKDPKALQLILQGSVRIQVNAGSLEYAKVFLGPVLQVQGKAKPGMTIGTYSFERLVPLAAAFEQFLDKCAISVELNRSLIKEDQVQLQEDLEIGFDELKNSLMPFIGPFLEDSSVSSAHGKVLQKPRSDSAGSGASGFMRNRSQSLVAAGSKTGRNGARQAEETPGPVINSVSAFTNKVINMTVNSIQRLPSISILGNNTNVAEDPVEANDSAKNLNNNSSQQAKPSIYTSIKTQLQKSDASSNSSTSSDAGQKQLKLQKPFANSTTGSPSVKSLFETPTSSNSAAEPVNNGTSAKPPPRPMSPINRMSTPPAIISEKSSEKSQTSSPVIPSRPHSTLSTTSTKRNETPVTAEVSELFKKFAQRASKP